MKILVDKLPIYPSDCVFHFTDGEWHCPDDKCKISGQICEIWYANGDCPYLKESQDEQ